MDLQLVDAWVLKMVETTVADSDFWMVGTKVAWMVGSQADLTGWKMVDNSAGLMDAEMVEK